MTIDDEKKICDAYKRRIYGKRQMIGVLAQLYCMTRQEILDLLQNHGMALDVDLNRRNNREKIRGKIDVETVRRYAEEGMTAQEITDALGGKWKKRSVQRVMERHGIQYKGGYKCLHR